ncbi:uncharacterized protein F5891DRAFT_985969 [Suillus fuscotomentosus]|uniref:Ribonuclease H1 N-terminal domain-containing protein n=1 Tax=Suillus fuscotomentosus TaxID=1912939 RepID=A0AAD4DT70_9AGAM|nr:uncharacterized protein F5891DRAFT_985969 [Suillus fuscotomentosus]KAG1893302.1 hypothetical protein F5891DRAFT_985969 [Suillus fuscotomentosus]
MTQSTVPQADTSPSTPPFVRLLVLAWLRTILTLVPKDAISKLLASLWLTPGQAKALVNVIMTPTFADVSSNMKGPSETSLKTTSIMAPTADDASSNMKGPGEPSLKTTASSNGGLNLSGIPAEDYVADPNTLSVYVTLGSYSDKLPKITVIEQSHEFFAKVADAMADECFLYFYHGILYNMPAAANPSAPYYCVMRGRYIGVFNGWDNVAPKVQGVPRTIFSKVDSLEAGEENLRRAIE